MDLVLGTNVILIVIGLVALWKINYFGHLIVRKISEIDAKSKGRDIAILKEFDKGEQYEQGLD